MSANTTMRARTKRVLAVGAVLGALAVAPVTQAANCTDPVGDITGDGSTNVADTVCIMLGSLWQLAGVPTAPLPACLAGTGLPAADFNCDGDVTVVDAQLHTQAVLGNPLGAGIDDDGNFCPDVCQTPVLGGPAVVVPTYFYGTASGGGLTVRPLAPGSTAVGSSSGGGLTVKPKAVGAP